MGGANEMRGALRFVPICCTLSQVRLVHGGKRYSSSSGYCESHPMQAPRLPKLTRICKIEPTTCEVPVYCIAVMGLLVVDRNAFSTPPANRWDIPLGERPISPRSFGKNVAGSVFRSSWMPRNMTGSRVFANDSLMIAL